MEAFGTSTLYTMVFDLDYFGNKHADPGSIGHCGHDTVNFVCKRLPLMIRTSLQALVSSPTDRVLNSELVSEALTNAIRHLDDSIRSDLFNFLPRDRLSDLSPDQLREHIQRHESKWETISARCTQGATVIFSLLDPSKRNLWVVNLGDSQAGEPLSPFRESFAFSST
jgi:pyruvate dehydrogenase phosphatase